MRFIEHSPEIFFLLGGSCAAFVMALMRSLRYTRKQLSMRVVEALMCSMLTTAFAMGLKSFWGVSYEWAIPMGTMIGFLGTDFIRAIVAGLLEFYTTKLSGSDSALNSKLLKEEQASHNNDSKHNDSKS